MRDLIREDSKRTFRATQIENEGNDPAKSGVSYGTPHDLASMYGRRGSDGQKTLQTKASALDRINVRRLLINLKRYVRAVAESLLFEQNTLTTRNNFVSQVNPYMESVQQRQGLYAYKVVMDDSNNTPDVIDRNQLVGAIYIQPAKTVEFIYITFNITPTGVTFGA